MSQHPSRRQFLITVAQGAALGICGAQANDRVAGPDSAKFAAYDDLMTAFMREHHPPGAALAVAHHGRPIFASGFGYADREARERVRTGSLFRIASLSKPFTAAAVMCLVEQGKLKLDDRVLPLLHLEPYLEPESRMDPNWREIRVRHCLQHTGGWDRGKSFDPMGAATAEEVAKKLKIPLPICAEDIIRYTLGKPLDFVPGTAYAYSNFGYCVLGRVIEAVSKKPYHEFVSERILAPLGIGDMRLGKNLLADRAPGEVKYYDSRQRTGRAISGPGIGQPAPLPYGVECIETMDANGGWIASAVDLVRFAAALENPRKCPILKEESIRFMLAPPPGPVGHDPTGRPKSTYYACGWNVRPAAGQPGKCTKWHFGLLAGSSTMLVCRADGFTWAVLFNSDADKNGREFAGLIDPLLHQVTDKIKSRLEINGGSDQAIRVS
ncbi:MAG: beta-lactamase family protein [Pirellulales bacterium]|nr:beta-lactamase family protein [Pirellulales bacterium]